MATKCPGCGLAFNKENVRSVEALRPHLFYRNTRSYPRKATGKRSPLSSATNVIVPHTSSKVITAPAADDLQNMIRLTPYDPMVLRVLRYKHKSEMAQLRQEMQAKIDAATLEITALTTRLAQAEADAQREARLERERLARADQVAGFMTQQVREAEERERCARERAERVEEELESLQRGADPSLVELEQRMVVLNCLLGPATEM